MIRNLFIALAVMIGLVAGAPVAHAAYPPAGTQVGSSASAYSPGDPVTLTATGFLNCNSQTQGGAPVTFTITPPGGGTPIVLTATADSTGKATVTFTLPAGGPFGTWTVVATSPGCATASSSFTVRSIPETGSDPSSSLWIAGIAVLLGAGLVLVAWRRRHHSAA